MNKIILALALGAGTTFLTPAHSDQVFPSEQVLSGGKILSQSASGQAFFYVVSLDRKIYFCFVKRDFINCDRPASQMFK